MKKKARLFGAYLPILLTILPIAVVLRTVACFKDMNSGGYFDNKILIGVANSVTVGLVVFLLSYLAVGRKNIKLVQRPTSPLNFIPSAVICAALLFVAIYSLFIAIPDLKAYFSLHPEDRVAKMLISPIIELAIGISAFGSIPYFVASAVWAKAKSIRISNLGLVMIVFLCLTVTGIYFDSTSPLNMPAKVISQMAYLSAAIFFLYELRLPLGRERWRAYICFGMICTALCAYSSIPSLIVYIARPETLHLLVTSEFEIALTAALFIFAAFKLILTATLIEDKESPIAKKVREAALARAESLEPKEHEEPEDSADEEAAYGQNEVREEEESAQIENQESFFTESELAGEEESEADTEDEIISELDEIPESRRLELSANIDNTTDNEEEADNQ